MIRRIWLLSVTLIFLSALIHSNTVWAQSSGSTTASVTGNIKDSNGAVIGGANISIKNISTNYIRSVSTVADGSFLISQLPPGSYDLIVEAEGFNQYQAHLELALGTTALVNAGLSLAGRVFTIEVDANTIVDEGKTASSTNIGSQNIDALPINRRNFLDFALITPRVVTDGVPVQGASASSGLSFNGQSARQNNITIDGLDNNDSGSGSVRSTFSQDAVQEFQVVSDSYSAEFGRALGGVVNIVTKGGSNSYHGTTFFFERNDKTSARDVFANVKPPYAQYQFGTSLSGPIKKDRAFFFTSFERLSIKQNNIVTISNETVAAAQRNGFALTNGPSPFSIDTSTFLLRGDLKISANDTFFARYNFGGTYNGALEPFGGLLGASNGGVQKLKDNSVVFSNVYINAGLNLINESRFLYSRRDQDVLPVDGGPQIRLFGPEGLSTFGRSSFLPQGRRARVYQIVDNVTLTRGRQQIRFGFDFLHDNLPDGKTNVNIFDGGLAVFSPLDFTALTGVPGLPFFSGLQAFDPGSRTPQQKGFLTVLASILPSRAPGFPAGLPLADLSLPLAYLQGFGDSRLTFALNYISGFVQDDIKFNPNLLVKVGLRYDLNRTTKFFPDNNGNFSPRLAFAYHPKVQPNLNVHGAYGLFFGTPLIGSASAINNTTEPNKTLVLPFPYAIVPFQLPGHHIPGATVLPANVMFIPQLTQQFAFQKDLRNSYTQQINFGLDYLLDRNTLISATYNFVRGIKLYSLRNINPITRPVPGDPLNSAILGRPDPTKGDFFELESSFDSYSHALTLSLNRRFSNHFGLLATYTFSKSIDNFIDFRADFEERLDSLRPNLDRSLSLQDARNRFVFSGIWDLSYTKNRLLTGFQLSTIVTLTSGRPYNLLSSVDLNMNGDNPPGDRPLNGGVSIGRNVGILPGFANTDLRLTRTIQFHEHYRIQGFAEVFNLFNRVNISDIDRTFSPDSKGNFMLPPRSGGRFVVTPDRYRNAFSPRQIQLGVRLTF